MNTASRSKSGQIAILLILLLAGLVLIFSLNVELFKAARSKLRLQNVADASAIAMARWQGMTINMIGELNIVHLIALSERVPVDEHLTNHIAGISALQRHLKSIGPIIGFDAANRLAKENLSHSGRKPIASSVGMEQATELIANHTPKPYGDMIKQVTSGSEGVFAGIDNVKVPNGPDTLLTKDVFYNAVRTRNFRELCRLGGWRHSLPSVGTEVPSAEDIFQEGCVGHVGVYESPLPPIGTINNTIDLFIRLANDLGYSNIDRNNLRTNSEAMFSTDPRMTWSFFDPGEWRDIPDSLKPGAFPWIDNLRINPTHAVMGGSCAIRVEEQIHSTNTNVRALDQSDIRTQYGESPETLRKFKKENIFHEESIDIIVAQSAAKVFGNRDTGNPLSLLMPMPVFSMVRSVPFAFGANGRDSMADINHVGGFPPVRGSGSRHADTLKTYHSQEFRDTAARWFAEHAHDEVCCPPTSGSGKRGGGTDRVP